MNSSTGFPDVICPGHPLRGGIGSRCHDDSSGPSLIVLSLLVRGCASARAGSSQVTMREEAFVAVLARVVLLPKHTSRVVLQFTFIAIFAISFNMERACL